MCKVTRVEQGWPGHFIAASECLFRRNTLLSRGGLHIVVSTVGACWSNYHAGRPKMIRIGHNRFYETMVFIAFQSGAYLDADAAGEINIERDTRWAVFAERAEDLPDDVDDIANDIHEENVDWFVENFDEAYANGQEEKEKREGGRHANSLR